MVSKRAASIDNGADVYIVDDDPAVRASISFLVGTDGLSMQSFEDCQSFLHFIHQHQSINQHGCLILDIRMPGMSGLELQDALKQTAPQLPIIFITGSGDAQIAVRAMKNGAFDFLVKPFADNSLLEIIHNAISFSSTKKRQQAEQSIIGERIQSLTPREYEIMQLVIEGDYNKTISLKLGISQKTVEIHRARIMRKMQAQSLANLITMVLTYDHNKETEAVYT